MLVVWLENNENWVEERDGGRKGSENDWSKTAEKDYSIKIGFSLAEEINEISGNLVIGSDLWIWKI